MLAKAVGILQRAGLSDCTQVLAHNLPHGKQRLLCLAVALASDPELLLLDEPVTGMNASEVADMLRLIKMLHSETGITSIVVEHNMPAVMSSATGLRLSATGQDRRGFARGCLQDPHVIEAYLGAEDGANQDVA